MRLCDLAEDVLALILTKELSSAVLALWQVGSRALMSKLANGGVKEIKLVSSKWCRPLPWPQCVNHFQLRVLSLTWNCGRRSDAQLRDNLLSLWKGLDELEIIAWNAERAFALEPPPSSFSEDVYNKPSAKRSKTKELSDETLTRGDFSLPRWDMSVTFPSLRSLVVGSWPSSDTGRYAQLHIGNFALLPRTLTHLDLSRNTVALLPSECAALPPSLETLVLPSPPSNSRWDTQESQNMPIFLPAINVGNIRHLPLSLTRIESDSEKESCFTHEALVLLAKKPSILPNLISFPSYSTLSIPALLADNDGRLPGSQVSLSVSSKDLNTWYNPTFVYPTSLTSLKLTSCGFTGQFLPRLLQHLEVSELDWTKIESTPDLFWPSLLKSLKLTGDDRFCVTHFPLLPRTLEKLEMLVTLGLTFDRSTSEAQSLAAGAETLTRLEAQTWSMLKEQLLSTSSMRLMSIDGDGTELMEEYVSAIESGRLYGLPLRLKVLKFGVSPYMPTCSPVMPPQVTELSLFAAGVNQGLPQHHLRLLPPSITTLCTGIRIINVHEFAHLGRPSIRTLQLRLSKGFPPKHLLALLNPRLHRLDLEILGKGPTIANEELEALPVQLRVLTIKGPRFNQTENWTHTLPRSLLELHVLGNSIDSKCLPLLPAGLLELTATYGIAHFQLENVLAAPRHLAIISMLASTIFNPPFKVGSWDKVYQLRHEAIQSAHAKDPNC